MLNRYTVKSRIEGSNPSVSASCLEGLSRRLCARATGSLGPSSQCGRKGRDDDEDAAKRKPSRSAARSDLRREGAKPVRGAGARLSDSAQRRRGARHAGDSGPGACVDGRAEIRDRDVVLRRGRHCRALELVPRLHQPNRGHGGAAARELAASAADPRHCRRHRCRCVLHDRDQHGGDGGGGEIELPPEGSQGAARYRRSSQDPRSSQGRRIRKRQRTKPRPKPSRAKRIRASGCRSSSRSCFRD